MAIEYSEDFKVRKIHITNFIDFKYKINDKLSFITSVGFKIENKDGHTQIDNSMLQSYIYENDNYQDDKSEKRKNTLFYSNYETKFPLNFKLIIVPQIQIKFDYFSMKIQIYQDMLNLNNHINKIDIGSLNYPTYTGVGIIFSTTP